MNYHRNYMPGFAKVSADLYTLVHAKDFIWTRQHQASFEKLKTLAITAPMHAHASPDGLFILDCDASGTQIGVELSQDQNGVIKHICYASMLKQPAKATQKLLHHTERLLGSSKVLSPIPALFAWKTVPNQN